MDISRFKKPDSFTDQGKELAEVSYLEGLTQQEINAIRGFNSKDGLLESVLTKIQNKLADKWLKSNPEHVKQRDWYFNLSQALGDVSKIISQCSNNTKD